jgi:hypothetical protein
LHTGDRMEDAVMTRSGAIALPSGRWEWALHDRWHGTLVVLQHRTRVYDEMRTWINGRDLPATVLLEHMLNPLERSWQAGGGLPWKLALEAPHAEVGPGPCGGGQMRLVFRRGRTAKVTSVPVGTRLAELTHDELLELLEQASEPGWSGAEPWVSPSGCTEMPGSSLLVGGS